MTKWVTSTELKRAVAKAKRDERKKRNKVERRLTKALRERKAYKIEAARHRRGEGAFASENTSLREENAQHRAMWSTRREGVPGWEMGDAPADPRAIRAHVGEVLDAILRDKDATREMSGLAKEKFDFVLGRFEEKANEDGNASPLFHGAKEAAGRQGTRMALPLRHQLLMVLAGKSEGVSQYFLRALFAVDRSTVGRHADFVDSILEEILPTADRVDEKLSSARTRREFKQLVPGHGRGVLIIDGTRTRRQRPKDKKERKASIGGRHKVPSYNTLVCTNKIGGVLWLGKTKHGRMNDKGALNEGEFSFGKWTANLHAKRVAPRDRFTLIWDLGFPGVEDMYPGHRVITPIKRRSGEELDEEEEEWNRWVGSRRVYVEHGIGRCKRFEVMQHPFRGSNEKYRRQLNIISGLANLNTFWDIISKDAWIGKKL